ncbi:MAG: cell division protein FtsQ/DivIB [Bacillota bacterium]
MSEKKLTVFIIVFILIGSLISFLFSPYFKLRNLIIIGTKDIDKRQVKQDLKEYFDQNIWLINTNEMEDDLSQKGYMKFIEIKKKLPDEIVIEIQERTPLFKINNDGEYLLINKNGFIIDKGSVHQFDVPEIQGVGYVFENNKIKFSQKFSQIVQAMAKLEVDKRKYVKKILKNDNKIELLLQKNVEVDMGTMKRLERKFAILDSLLDRYDNKDIEYIDLSIPSKPVIKNS